MGTLDRQIVVKSPITTPVVLLALLIGLQAGQVAAQPADSFPSVPLNVRTVRAQEQAENLFEHGDFQRAFLIYRHELAPIGDKYSQYMVGYMLLTGSGVREDRVAAAAWYRLAAERGTPEFIVVRDQLLSSLSSKQIAASDRVFLQLRREIGDLPLIMRAVRADYDILLTRTGSRLAPDSSPVTVIDVRGPRLFTSGNEFYGRIEKRMQARLDYIAAKAGITDLDLFVGNLNLPDLEARVAKALETLD